MSEVSLEETQRPKSFISRHRWAPYLLITLAMLFWSGDIIVVRAARFDIPPVALVFWQCLIATLVLFPFIYRQLFVQMPILIRHWRTIVLFGILQAVTGQTLLYMGVHHTPAVNAGLLVATMPVVIIVLARFILRDAITWSQGIAVALAMVGITAIVTQGNFTSVLGIRFEIGDLWVQCAIISFSLYTVLVKKLMPDGLNPFVFFQAIVVCAVIILIPLYGIETAVNPMRIEFNLMTAGVILYIAVFGWILALVFFTVSITYIGPARAGFFTNLSPVFTVLLAVLLLGEVLQSYHYLGMVLVFASVYLATLKGKKGG